MKHARASLISSSNFFSRSLIAFALLASAATITAQNVQHPEATVDHGFRSDLKVDPSTLALSLQLPLRVYPGRAGVNVPVTLYYSSKVWTMEYGGYYQEGACCAPSFTANPQGMPTDNEYSWVNVYYGMSSAGQGSNAGWTGSLDFPYVIGGMIARYDFEGNPCDACELNQSVWIKRLRIRMPDGSAHELRRSDALYYSNIANDIGTYYAVDGSNLRYVEENTSGAATLYLPDGSRYLMGQSAPQYIDKNGNKLTYNTNGTITDTLGRTVGLQYVSGTADQIYSLPGINGTPAYYTLRYRSLGDTGVMTAPGPLSNVGDMMPYGSGVYGPALFPSGGGTRTTSPALFNPTVLHQLTLPNGQSYTFTYNVYGEIDKVIYPGGGYEKFRYEMIPALDPLNEPYAYANRGVVERWVSPDGSDNNLSHWTYSVVSSSPYTIRTTAPDGSYSERVLQKGRGPGVLKYGFDDARAGLPLEERAYSASGQMLRRTLMYYVVSGPQTGGYSGATRNPRLTKKVDIVLDTGGDALAAITTMAYDADLNVISTEQYHYITVSSSTAQTGSIDSFVPTAPPARTSEATFLVNDAAIDPSIRAAYRDRNLLGLATSSRVKDSNGTIVAQSSIGYDETSLQPIGGVDGWIDPQNDHRGNATSIRSWLNTTNSYLTTYATYDQFGNVRTTTDPKGNQSQVDYSSTYSYAYPTLTTSADPDGGGPLTPLTTAAEYDHATGLTTAAVDANGQRTTFAYNDPLNRLRQAIRAVNGGVNEKSQTTIEYDDANRTVTTTTDQNTYNDNLLKSEVVYDGLGRAAESRQYETATNYIAVRTQYDALGRAFKTSNPFRSGESVVWTIMGFDALGRVISVTTPDNAAVTTAYNGNRVLVSDQAGKKRVSKTDALGRLKDVWEVTTADSAAEAISFPGFADVAAGYRTSYAYDTLDDLTTVTQGAQTRSFVYDSLKRLTSASNPEGGTVNYQYDNNGNLTQKTDARSITTNYVYDPLNRVTSRTYSDGTPTVTYAYDSTTIANGKGRLASVSSSVSAYACGDYDAMGRATGGTQTIGSRNYYVGYTYDLAGHVKTITYPSGRSITNTLDAAGRLSSFTGNLGDGTQRTYASALAYSPFGGMTQEQFGTTTPVYDKKHYNVRGQLYDVRASTQSMSANEWDWNRGAIINYYASADLTAASNDARKNSGPDNNGNVIRQDNWIPNNDQVTSYGYFRQNYSYDPLNRLASVTELQNGTTGTFAQVYNYDRYGNRTVDQVNTWGGVPKPNFGVDAATNRLTAPAGYTMGYDAAGNLTNDTYTGQGTRTYDAENRMTGAQASSASSYAYDGDGRRIKRTVNGVETWQIYGLGGELLAEYAANAAPSSPQKEYGYRNGELLVTADVPQTVNLNGYSYRRTVTIDHNKVPNTDQSNFPMFVSGTYSYLATTGNGGSVQNPNGYDVIFTSDSGCVNKLNHEVESYNANTGAVNYWVQAPSVSHTSDTTIYLCYGNANITTDQSNKTGVWDANYKAVFHLPNGTTLSATDSTANANNATVNGATATAGKTGGSAAGNSSSQNVSAASNTSLNPTANVTVETWVKTTQKSVFLGMVDKYRWDSGNNYGYLLDFKAADGKPRFVISKGTAYGEVVGPADIANGGWHQVVGSYDGSYVRIYVDGVQVNATACTGNLTVDTSALALFGDGVSTNFLNGSLDEVRVSLSTRSADWIASQFNNQNSPNTFYTIAAAESASGPAQLHWLVTDQLGTPRMVFDQTGSLANTSRHDYLPFGEELFAGTGGRTTAQGYSASDNVRQQFTQKERDNETGLDYFINRYYSSAQGRFASVDPYNIIREVYITAQADPTKAETQLQSFLKNAQYWNRYAYTLNNPLKYIDPTGELIELTGSKEDKEKGFKRIKELVGRVGAAHLVMKDICTSGGHCGTYVDYDETLSGRQALAGSSRLNRFISEIIDSDRTVEFSVAESFSTRFRTNVLTGSAVCGGGCTVGAEESLTGNTQIFVHPDAGNRAQESFNRPINGFKFKGGAQLDFYDDIVDGHEFGHAYANAIENKPIRNSNASDSRAVEFENLVRDRYPMRARRTIE